MKRLTQGFILLSIAACLLHAVPGLCRAESWWDQKWQHRKKIVFNTTSQGADVKENLGETPILLRFHTGNLEFSKVNDGGADIRLVASDDKTVLKHHIDLWDKDTELGLVWVKLPKLAALSNQEYIWVYYGNEKAAAAQETGSSYDVNQVLVLHLEEREGQPKDTTAFGNHVTTFTGSQGIPASIGTGISLNGTSDFLTVSKSPSLNFAKGITFSAWVRLQQPMADARLFSWDENGQGVAVGIDQTKPYVMVMASSQGSPPLVTEKTTEIPIGEWHHVAAVVDPGRRMAVFLDGVEIASKDTVAKLPEVGADLFFASSSQADKFLAGDLDEVQLSNVPRSPAWIRAQAKSQGADGTFATYQDAEVGSSGQENLTIHYMKVVARTISPDGWMVIGFCAIVGVITFVIVIIKAIALRQTRRDNDAFSDVFVEVMNPMELKLENGDYGNSSMRRVFESGRDTVGRWLKQSQTAPDGSARLSTTGLNAFKASLDKATVNESKRMSSGMFMLIISISGGPFLGLLGTVWGVINTFAGMAEAGEANLMAIAPGVASALACTLAGLVVAIPALFANTYLAGRMKEMTMDMNIFVDELILKIEGEYGGSK
ncbi:MAG: DUF2341 domain-containing protein [Syntrophobacteraceae bacterium]